MRVLVTGVNGQLGHDVVKELNKQGIANAGYDRQHFDLVDPAAVMDAVRAYAPTHIIHCAAYTAVDQAEDEPELCHAVNATGTQNMATAAKTIGAKLLYISTDYVFDGAGTEPYATDHPTAPQSVYGASKLAGEQAVQATLAQHYIVRISWVFGINGNNFVKTMLRLGAERSELNIVADQIGSPTYTADLAPLLAQLIQTDNYGIYHATNAGFCSWADFAAEIFAQAGLPTVVNPIPSEAFPTKATRPKNSRLDKSSLAIASLSPLPSWQEALQHYLKELNHEQS